MILGYVNSDNSSEEIISQCHLIKLYASEHHYDLDIIHSGIGLDELCRKMLHHGDTLIVAEIRCLGNSLNLIKNKLSFFADKQIEFISIREGYNFTSDKKYLLEGMEFALNIRKHMVSSITKTSLHHKKASGTVLGCKKGQKLKKKLDGRQCEIQSMLSQGISKRKIAQTFGVSIATVYNFIRNNQLKGQKSE